MSARPSSLPVIISFPEITDEAAFNRAKAELARIEDRQQRRVDAIAKANLERFIARTGPTTRLERACPTCHDTPPQGAAYCINCGEPL